MYTEEIKLEESPSISPEVRQKKKRRPGMWQLPSAPMWFALGTMENMCTISVVAFFQAGTVEENFAMTKAQGSCMMCL